MAFKHFLEGYIACALWTSSDEGEASHAELFTRADIAAASLQMMERDALRFYEAHSDAWRPTDYEDRCAGHDFWRSRGRHLHDFAFGNRGCYLESKIDQLIESARSYGQQTLDERDGVLVLVGGRF